MIWLLAVMVLVFIGAIGVMANDDWLPYLLWTMLCVLVTLMMFGITHPNLAVDQTFGYILTHWF